MSGVASAQDSTAMLSRLDGAQINKGFADSIAFTAFTAAKVAGAQVVYVDSGNVAWSYAFGQRRREPSLPMEHTTTTWAASITKGVFATYVMQLVERGEFDLDLPVARQLAKPLDQYGPYAKSATEVVKDPLWPTITPRMLLAHTGGLLNFASMEPDGLMRLHFKPGSRFQYSGEGINLVQFVVEQQKKASLDTLMQDAIFGPLGMRRTGLIYRTEFADNVADRYDADGKFLSKTTRFPARGAGSMTSSAEDVARFATALMAGQVIQPGTMRAMLRPFVEIRTLHQFPVAANEPEGKEAERVGLAYGMGWGLLTKTPYGPAFFKEGHGDGAQNYMICFERRRACMVILTNSDNGEKAFRAILQGVMGENVTPWEWEGYP
ncbi:MAG: serine hydrolase domain-containing protein [Gemmatimonadaceae bacterium]